MVITTLKDQTSNIVFHGHVHAVGLTDVRFSGQHIQDAHINDLT